VANNWLITGTSSGFGRTLTELALERGDNVVATVRKPSALDDLKERYGNRLRVSILDVTNAKEIVSVVDGAFDALGKIDFAVSNAGYIMVGAAEEAELPRIERLLDTNLLGSIVFAKAVIPHMRKQGGGRILQISSEQSQMAYPGMSVYATTKWGIEGFFEGVIPEIARKSITNIRTDWGTTSEMTGPLMTSFSWNFQVIAAPILAGLDKFFNILVNWEKYLAPFVGNLIAPGLFMAVVGVVEIAAGIGVAIKPRIYAYVVAAWLVGIILNLLILPGYFDVALRDLGLALGALALGRLSQKYDRPWRWN
jgi:NADP-dependent 3-hydroxy acid dehydrogenase YdfG